MQGPSSTLETPRRQSCGPFTWPPPQPCPHPEHGFAAVPLLGSPPTAPSPSCLCLCFPLSRKVSLGSASELGLEVCSEGREEIPTLGPVATHNTHSSDLRPCPPHCACKMMPSWTAVPIAFGTTPFLG